MKLKIFIVGLLGLLLITGGCINSGSLSPSDSSVIARQLRPGSAYDLFETPQAATMYSPPGKVGGGSPADVLETRGEWVRIRQGNAEGWLPGWYILDNADPVKDVDSDYLVLNRPVDGLLYPEGPQITSLSKGKLLLPLKEWKGWVQVQIIVYNIPAVMTAWIQKSNLSPVSTASPSEGFLKQGARVYEVEKFEEIARSASTEAAYDMPVCLRQAKGGYLYVEAAGGWSSWTRRDNVKYSCKSSGPY